MPYPILTSAHGDPLPEALRQRIPGDLEKRVIGYSINFDQGKVDRDDATQFFSGYRNELRPEYGPFTVARRYFLDQFFMGLRKKFDVVMYDGEPYSGFMRRSYDFTFTESGHSVRAVDRASLNRPLTLDRLATLRSEEKEMGILCEFISRERPRSFSQKMQAAKTFFPYAVASLFVAPSDSFAYHLDPHCRDFLAPFMPGCSNGVERHLRHHPNNLFLVYSATREEIRIFGEEVKQQLLEKGMVARRL